jgi:hypothetical protein
VLIQLAALGSYKRVAAGSKPANKLRNTGHQFRCHLLDNSHTRELDTIPCSNCAFHSHVGVPETGVLCVVITLCTYLWTFITHFCRNPALPAVSARRRADTAGSAGFLHKGCNHRPVSSFFFFENPRTPGGRSSLALVSMSLIRWMVDLSKIKF